MILAKENLTVALDQHNKHLPGRLDVIIKGMKSMAVVLNHIAVVPKIEDIFQSKEYGKLFLLFAEYLLALIYDCEICNCDFSQSRIQVFCLGSGARKDNSENAKVVYDDLHRLFFEQIRNPDNINVKDVTVQLHFAFDQIAHVSDTFKQSLMALSNNENQIVVGGTFGQSDLLIFNGNIQASSKQLEGDRESTEDEFVVESPLLKTNKFPSPGGLT